jgi:hypothetical protein
MKRSPVRYLSLHHLTKAPPSVDDGTGMQRVRGLSRWSALDRKRFPTLIASPVKKDAPEGGPTSC